jgi:hypothetical protein
MPKRSSFSEAATFRRFFCVKQLIVKTGIMGFSGFLKMFRVKATIFVKILFSRFKSLEILETNE